MTTAQITDESLDQATKLALLYVTDGMPAIERALRMFNIDAHEVSREHFLDDLIIGSAFHYWNCLNEIEASGYYDSTKLTLKIIIEFYSEKDKPTTKKENNR